MPSTQGASPQRLRSNNKMGVIIPHNKATAEMPTVEMPLPTKIVMPMQQHVGAQCKPLVKKKDRVKVGQLIGHAEARTTADIFSPVSGTVTELRTIYYSNGRSDTAIVIEPDGEQTIDETIAPPEITDYASLVAAVKKSGLVGLGGAGFPTGLKMDTDLSNIDCWLVNGAECEPYLSSDYREMMERPQDLIDGIKLCLDLSGVPKSLICIEDNKPKAIELLRELAADDPRIQVLELPARYPQGASRVILKNATGRAVPAGGHLTDVGAILFNCTTMGEIARYVRTGMPLIQQIVHAGDILLRPDKPPVSLFLAGPEFDDAGGFFKNLAPILSLAGQDIVYTALTDDGVTFLPDACIPEQIHHILQTAGCTVQVIFTFAAAVNPAGNQDLRILQRKSFVFIVKSQGDFTVTQGFPPLGTAEDDILHAGAAQGLRTLFPKHPAHRVSNIALSGSVRSHDCGDAFLEDNLSSLRERLKPVELQLL